MTSKTSPALHEQVMHDLPWYVNGTLDPEQRLLVAEHLRVCAACRTEVEMLTRVQRVTQREPVDSEVDEARLDRLMNTIDRSPLPTRPAFRDKIRGMFDGLLGLSPQWGLALGALTLVALLTAMWPGEHIDDPGSPYQTLSTEDPMSTPPIVIEFDVNPQLVSETRLRELADSAPGGHLAQDGPGRYRLMIDAAARPSEVLALLDRLKGDPAVQSARLQAR